MSAQREHVEAIVDTLHGAADRVREVMSSTERRETLISTFRLSPDLSFHLLWTQLASGTRALVLRMYRRRADAWKAQQEIRINPSMLPEFGEAVAKALQEFAAQADSDGGDDK